MILSKLFTQFRILSSCRKGNFGLITALLALPGTLMLGASVDLWNAYEVKTRLDCMADAAALAAVGSSSRAFINNGRDGETEWRRDAERFFQGQKQAIAPAIIVSVSANVWRDRLHITSLVDYKADYPTVFMGMIGISHMSIKGAARAEFNVGEFYNVNVLVDNSPSMGIGASKTDIDVMQARIACAFACHDKSNQWNTLAKANTLGVRLRIDVVTESLRKLADMINTRLPQKELYRLSLYSLGATAEAAVARPLALVQPATQDLEKFTASARAIKLMSMPKFDYNNYAVGNINTAIALMNKEIPSSGTGTGINDPRQVLLLITDGVEDKLSTASQCYGIFQSGRCVQYIDVNECQKLKNRGVVVAVLHTEYLPIASNDNYAVWVRGIARKIGPALQACASPDLYQAVDMTSDMSQALNGLFRRATNMPRLTR